MFILALVLMQNVDQTEGFDKCSDRITIILVFFICTHNLWKAKGTNSPRDLQCENKT